MADYSHIYLIGIGGIGMSAIARYYKFKGYEVSGFSRRAKWPLSMYVYAFIIVAAYHYPFSQSSGTLPP